MQTDRAFLVLQSWQLPSLPSWIPLLLLLRRRPVLWMNEHSCFQTGIVRQRKGLWRHGCGDVVSILSKGIAILSHLTPSKNRLLAPKAITEELFWNFASDICIRMLYFLIFLLFSSHSFIIKCLLLALPTFLYYFSEKIFSSEGQMEGSDFNSWTAGWWDLSGHHMRSRNSIHGNGYRFYGKDIPFWTGNWRTIRLIWSHSDGTRCPSIAQIAERVGENSPAAVGFYWREFVCDESRFPKYPLWFIKRKGFTLTVKWCHYVLPLEILNWTLTSSEMTSCVSALGFISLNFNLFNSHQKSKR